jgi:predicted PhzF superfamily epimerase YddE/YHI9
MAVTAEVVNVFARADGTGGNPLGFVRGRFDADDRQQIAADLGYSETVFALDGTHIAIHTPTVELPFAGHPAVGAAWLLNVEVIQTSAGPVRARSAGDSAFVVARADMCPRWDTARYRAAAEIDALPVPVDAHLQCWAWIDEGAGRIRARVFAGNFGVPEDPATGSAAIRLCMALGRPIVIEQGTGSEIVARPLDDDEVELGGRVVRHPDRTV